MLLVFLLLIRYCISFPPGAVNEIVRAPAPLLPDHPVITTDQFLQKATEQLPEQVLHEIYFKSILTPPISVEKVFQMISRNLYLANQFLALNNPTVNNLWMLIMNLGMEKHLRLFQKMLLSPNLGT